jgi:hypothetical protein
MAESSNGNGRMSATELARAARQAIEELGELPVESISGLQWDGDKWQVSVDVRELERIPNTTDVMATYVVDFDEDGSLLGYHRTRRYLRGQAEGG